MRQRARLPSLNALRAFEAAARHLSFTRSARELSVTQAAVSHQVKALETQLGLRLFERRTRALALTDEGRAYLPVVSDAFDRVAEATERLTSGDVKRRLTVSVVPSLAARWLVPRLKRFRRLHPEIDLRLVPSTELANVNAGDADVGIRWGLGRYPGLSVTHLVGDEVFPVASPSTMRGNKRPRAPRDLARQVLLHDENHADWQEWLGAFGGGVEPRRGIVFTDASLMIQAAIEGLGVAMGRRVLVREELRAGRLVRPFAEALPCRFSYYFVCAKARAEDAKIAAFRGWLVSETVRDERRSVPRH